jgi:hypothetical protein
MCPLSGHGDDDRSRPRRFALSAAHVATNADGALVSSRTAVLVIGDCWMSTGFAHQQPRETRDDENRLHWAGPMTFQVRRPYEWSS